MLRIRKAIDQTHLFAGVGKNPKIETSLFMAQLREIMAKNNLSFSLWALDTKLPSQGQQTRIRRINASSLKKIKNVSWLRFSCS